MFLLKCGLRIFEAVKKAKNKGAVGRPVAFVLFFSFGGVVYIDCLFEKLPVIARQPVVV